MSARVLGLGDENVQVFSFRHSIEVVVGVGVTLGVTTRYPPRSSQNIAVVLRGGVEGSVRVRPLVVDVLAKKVGIVVGRLGSRWLLLLKKPPSVYLILRR